jgi:hypothetical protein
MGASGRPILKLDLDTVPSTTVKFYGCEVRNEDKSVTKEFDYEAAFKRLVKVYDNNITTQSMKEASKKLRNDPEFISVYYPYTSDVLKELADLFEDYYGRKADAQKQKVQNEIKELKQKVQELEAQANKL